MSHWRSVTHQKLSARVETHQHMSPPARVVIHIGTWVCRCDRPSAFSWSTRACGNPAASGFRDGVSHSGSARRRVHLPQAS